MNYYKIAGLNIGISSEDKAIFDKYEVFKIDEKNTEKLIIEAKRVQAFDEPKGIVINNEKCKWTKNNDKYNLSIYNDDNEIIASMDTNENWNEGSIKYQTNNNIWEWKITLPFFEIIFRNYLIHKAGIVIHAAAITWNDKAILFTAPSETGKTTQANLWIQHMDAKILNGDRPALRFIDDELYAFGTAWSGSSEDYVNEKAPLSAIVLLEQSKENTISRLNSIQAINKILPRFFLPYNDEKMMNLAMNTVENILEKTPIFLLKCRPDIEAAEITRKAIENL